TARRLKIRAVRSGQRRLSLPSQTPGSRPMRTRHVDKGAVFGAYIGQEQPSLDRGVKGVRVQLRLRIGRRLAGVCKDRLDIDEGFEKGRSDMGYGPAPWGALAERAPRRHARQSRPIQGDPPRHGIALPLLAGHCRKPESLLLERLIDAARQ